MYGHEYYCPESKDHLRNDDDYEWSDKKYNCYNCDKGNSDFSVASCKKCSKHHDETNNKEKNHPKKEYHHTQEYNSDKNVDQCHDKLHEYLAKAEGYDQKLVSGISIKFKNVTINNKDLISFDKSGYRFKLHEAGEYALKFSTKLDSSIKGLLNVNITDHSDINYSFDGDEFKTDFKFNLKKSAYVNLKFILPHPIRLECVCLYVSLN